MLEYIYKKLPGSIRPAAKTAYYGLPWIESPAEKQHQQKQQFISTFFDGEAEYEGYHEEFRSGAAADIRAEAEERYFGIFDYSFGAVDFEIGADYYALVRALEPNRIVETGVCNGFSTLAILMTLNENESGQLVSIDFPRRADDSLQDHLLGEYGKEDFEDQRVWKAPCIPPGEDPGWIIPSFLRDRWTLRIGKSQRELPREVCENGKMDLFFHDSEHTMTCMLFEYDLAWAWLRDGGVIVSDDVHLNNAYEQFKADRGGTFGNIREDTGFLIPPQN